jgi:elongation factor Ts
LAISTSIIKELREKTGVGIMDCKTALNECNGDIGKAIDHLRKKGIATAKKRGGRVTSQGQVQSYIHAGGKIGVLVEINCETDFTGKVEDFTNMVKDIAMQIAATSPIAIDRPRVPEDIMEKEKDIYATQARDSGKPENIIEKIVEGKLKKFFSEACLLVAKTGENIVIRRFVRFQLGESD